MDIFTLDTLNTFIIRAKANPYVGKGAHILAYRPGRETFNSTKAILLASTAITVEQISSAMKWFSLKTSRFGQ